MSARVPMLPANPTRSLILDGYPVASPPLLDMAALLNHVQGMGAQVVPCYSPGQAITASCWVWCTSAVTAGISCSINWFTVAGTYVTTSSNSVSAAV